MDPNNSEPVNNPVMPSPVEPQPQQEPHNNIVLPEDPSPTPQMPPVQDVPPVNPSPTVPTTPTVPTAEKKSKKFPLIFVIAGILMLGVVGGVLVLVKTSTPATPSASPTEAPVQSSTPVGTPTAVTISMSGSDLMNSIETIYSSPYSQLVGTTSLQSDSGCAMNGTLQFNRSGNDYYALSNSNYQDATVQSKCNAASIYAIYTETYSQSGVLYNRGDKDKPFAKIETTSITPHITGVSSMLKPFLPTNASQIQVNTATDDSTSITINTKFTLDPSDTSTCNVVMDSQTKSVKSIDCTLEKTGGTSTLTTKVNANITYNLVPAPTYSPSAK